MQNKNVLIIGGADGIGREMAEHLVATHHVLIVGCSAKKGQAFLETHGEAASFVAADVSLLSNVVALANQIKQQYSCLDFIIHTADILRMKRVSTAEGLETSIAINYYSRVLLNHLLLEQFQPERILHIAAAGYPGGSDFAKKFPIADNASSFTGHGYGQIANDIYGLFVHDSLQKRGTKINILNPGMVDTDIRRNGQFPKVFQLLEPVLGLLLKPFTTTPTQYAQIPLAIVRGENEAADQQILINAKGKAIKGSKTVNDPAVQQYAHEQTWQTIENLVNVRPAPTTA